MNAKRLVRFTVPVLCLVVTLGVAAPPVGGDAIDDALALAGMRRSDLGWEPKGWWPRFPDAPYKLRAFDSLFAAPLDTVPFARALAAAAREGLDPAKLDERDGNNSTALFRTAQRLGIDPKFGGFRGYTANLLAPETPLDQAILDVMERSNRPTTISTFAMELPYPRPKATLAEEAKKLPAGVSPILGRLVLNIAEAHRWAELAFRKVDASDRLAVSRRLDVGDEMIDAYDYFPAMDDVARTLDEASLWYAAQKCVQALDDARIALSKLGPQPSFAFDYESPLGWIRVRGGGNDTVDGSNALLIVDLGGNDTYTGPVAASDAGRPVGALLDLGGDDRYLGEGPAQGAGLTGVGVLLDAAGNDRYEATRYAQGVGQFGFGLLADLGGDDTYAAKFSAQGAGYFGVGLLLDVQGRDRYNLWGDGQGLGGVAGVGVLADGSGDDTYTAVREHSVTGRPSYHSPGLDVGVSYAQGVGAGRRGDGADGHSWAGGLGALLDGTGNDTYTSGNWAMGTGYWFGIGVLHDGAGDDKYAGGPYTQATGAHFCIGVLVDEAGNDTHTAVANSHSSIVWAHDFTISVLADMAGDDSYQVSEGGLAYSINRSVAILLEAGGNDVYRSEKVPHPGFARNDERFRSRDGVSTYFADTSSIALFLDAGGRDAYWGNLENGGRWLDEPRSANLVDRNFSVGVDREGGTIDLTPTPVRKPSARSPAK